MSDLVKASQRKRWASELLQWRFGEALEVIDEDPKHFAVPERRVTKALKGIWGDMGVLGGMGLMAELIASVVTLLLRDGKDLA